MIKNIVLDMGNVLFDYNPDFVVNTFCSSEEEKAVIKSELFGGPEWELGDKGVIRDRDRYDLVKVRVPEEYHEALRKCAYEWDICMKPLPGAKDFCNYVKDSGYRVFVLSNASDLFYQYFPRLLPLEFFDGVFVSADHLMLKPDSEIYETFLDEYGLKAEECLFIDDRELNVKAAAELGFKTFRFAGDFEVVKRLFL